MKKVNLVCIGRKGRVEGKMKGLRRREGAQRVREEEKVAQNMMVFEGSCRGLNKSSAYLTC